MLIRNLYTINPLQNKKIYKLVLHKILIIWMVSHLDHYEKLVFFEVVTKYIKIKVGILLDIKR